MLMVRDYELNISRLCTPLIGLAHQKYKLISWVSPQTFKQVNWIRTTGQQSQLDGGHAEHFIVHKHKLTRPSNVANPVYCVICNMEI